MNPPPRFLSVDDVLTLHAIAIEDQGGDPSVRDRGLLESAIAMPAQQFGQQYLHEDIQAMAAAYAFHICSNHPFVDGNKRAATAAMIAFLSDNGWSFDATSDDAEANILRLASGSLNKSTFTEWARTHMREKPKMEVRDFSVASILRYLTNGLLVYSPHTGAGTHEFAQRAAEAAVAMPILDDLARQQQETVQAGNVRDWERITFLAVGLMTLHALAEDMGYEW